MKTPKFWQKQNLIAYLLLPFSYCYQLAAFLNQSLTRPVKVNKPIICIGNLTAGGAGKTPIAIELGLMLKKMGINFAYLSRGYGGNINHFTLVENQKHQACQTGDEPLLLAEISNCFIAKNKLFGAQQIAKMPDKKLIIMDDGLQNRSLIKDFTILVIDGIYGLGNNFIIPAGPLRQNIADGIKQADLIIIIGEDQFNIAKLCQHKKIIFAKIKVTNAAQFKNKNLIAFCGLGRPQKFFDSLKEIDNNIIKTISYPDHYLYQNNDLEKMIKLANQHNAWLVTSKKDWVRFDRQYQKQIKYLDITIQFDDQQYLKTKLKNLALAT